MSDKEIDKKLGDLIIYQNEKGETKIDSYFSDDTIWMTQKSLSVLYQVSTKTINEHIINIYQDGELKENSTIRKFRIVQKEGSRNVERDLNHYNLQMIFAIGYRVRNNIGIHFRNWATRILEEYTKKGFVMNDVRQGELTLTAPLDNLKERFIDGKIIHNNNSMFYWYVGNTKMTKRGPNATYMPTRQHRYRKIDGFMALLAAHTEWMRKHPLIIPSDKKLASVIKLEDRR